MLLRLAARYAELGHEQLICLRKPGWLAEEVARRGFAYEIVPLEGRVSLSWLIRMRRLVQRRRVTAIHAHEFYMNLYGTLLGVVTHRPVVTTVHGQNYYPDRAYRRWLYAAASRCSRMVAVSDDLRRFLQQKLGPLGGPVQLIRNGIDVAEYRHAQARRDARRETLGLSRQDRLIVSVGSYYDVKGHAFLIDAVQRLASRDPRSLSGVRLVIVGQGPLHASLQARVRSLGLIDCIDVPGYVDDVPELLAAADVFALPSLFEGLPLSLLEAAASRCAIVASAVGGIPEVVREGQSGLLVPPRDADALADALARVLEEPDLRRRLACEAERLVEHCWSFEETAQHYLDLMRVGRP